MNPETAKFLAIIVPILIAGILWMAVRLMYAAGKSMVEAKTVDPTSVGLVVLILVLVLIGVRYYPPMLGNAFLDGFKEVWGLYDDLATIINDIANESARSWNINETSEELPIVPDVPAVIIATPEFTATPFPTPSVNFAATATAYFESHPTAVPPQPTATLEPTRYVCRTIQDIQAGCTPPTPVPGN
jgi:hypothetical protein